MAQKLAASTVNEEFPEFVNYAVIMLENILVLRKHILNGQ